jgi:hypothetical protein
MIVSTQPDLTVGVNQYNLDNVTPTVISGCVATILI